MQKRELALAILAFGVFGGCSEGNSSNDGNRDIVATGDAVSEQTGQGDASENTSSSTSDVAAGDAGNLDRQEPEITCASECGDGLACTFDECVDDECVHTLDADSCLVDGVCYGAFELNPEDTCQLCDPLTGGWAAVPDAEINCDDGDLCTLEDMCTAGVCVGTPKDCNDDYECTDDVCSSESGTAECVYTPNTGPCDDEDVCTEEDVCSEAGCAGFPKCDDGDPCTEDTCGVDGECESVAVVCDDGNPCTSNECDSAAGGCLHLPVADGTPCEGLNLCVNGDACASGSCVDGSEPVDCDGDDNPCTDNACQPMVGCVAFFNSDPCDDGFACTINDSCNASVCSGTPQNCQGCTEVISEGVTLKATVMLVGEDGFPGDGLDVDGDPTTCSPLNCSDGIDNAMGDLAEILNPILTQSIATGENAPLIEIRNQNGNGSPFDVAIYNGVAEKYGEDCDVLLDVCQYEIIPGSLLPDCTPTMLLTDVVLKGDKMTGGGPSTVLVMGLPLAPGEVHYIVIVGGKVDAQVEFAEDGETIVGLTGLVAGAIPKTSLMDSLSNIDPSLFGGSGLSVEQFIELVNVVLKEDIDLDGNGENDAASIGIQITAIPGVISGIQGN